MNWEQQEKLQAVANKARNVQAKCKRIRLEFESVTCELVESLSDIEKLTRELSEDELTFLDDTQRQEMEYTATCASKFDAQFNKVSYEHDYVLDSILSILDDICEFNSEIRTEGYNWQVKDWSDL